MFYTDRFETSGRLRLGDQFGCGLCIQITHKKLLKIEVFRRALNVPIADEVAAKKTLKDYQQSLQSANAVS